MLLQQEGTFATGEEDVVDASGEARMRIAYREAAIALLECYFPNPWRPFTKVHRMGNFIAFLSIPSLFVVYYHWNT